MLSAWNNYFLCPKIIVSRYNVYTTHIILQLNSRPYYYHTFMVLFFKQCFVILYRIYIYCFQRFTRLVLSYSRSLQNNLKYFWTSPWKYVNVLIRGLRLDQVCIIHNKNVLDKSVSGNLSRTRSNHSDITPSPTIKLSLPIIMNCSCWRV